MNDSPFRRLVGLSQMGNVLEAMIASLVVSPWLLGETPEYYVHGVDLYTVAFYVVVFAWYVQIKMEGVELKASTDHQSKLVKYYKEKLQEAREKESVREGDAAPDFTTLTDEGEIYDLFGIDRKLLEQASSEYHNYSTEERQALQAFRDRWEAVKVERREEFDTAEDEERVEGDFVLYKFLKARRYDLDKSLAMYIEFRKYRKRHDVRQHRDNARGNMGKQALLEAVTKSYEHCDNCETHPSLRLIGPDWKNEAVFRAYCSAANRGFARNGCPIYIERTGDCSATYGKMMGVITGDDVVERHIRQQEMALARCEEISLVLGKPVGKQFLIFDLKGMSYWPNKAAMDVFRRVLHIDANYYPETLNTHILINAPAVFTGIWSIVSSWLDPRTREKFLICGKNYQETLLLHVHPSQLPREYGGSQRSYILPSHECNMDEGREKAKELWNHLVPGNSETIREIPGDVPRTPPPLSNGKQNGNGRRKSPFSFIRKRKSPKPSVPP